MVGILGQRLRIHHNQGPDRCALGVLEGHACIAFGSQVAQVGSLGKLGLQILPTGVGLAAKDDGTGVMGPVIGKAGSPFRLIPPGQHFRLVASIIHDAGEECIANAQGFR